MFYATAACVVCSQLLTAGGMDVLGVRLKGRRIRKRTGAAVMANLDDVYVAAGKQGRGIHVHLAALKEELHRNIRCIDASVRFPKCRCTTVLLAAWFSAVG